ncbi:hypothetical protein D3C80_1035440 [compost metagenome]
MATKSGSRGAITAPGDFVFATPLSGKPCFQIFLHWSIGGKQGVKITLLHLGVKGHPIGLARSQLPDFSNPLGIQGSLLRYRFTDKTPTNHLARFHLVGGVTNRNKAHRLEQMDQPQSAAQRALRHHGLRLLAARGGFYRLVTNLDGLFHVHTQHVAKKEALGILAVLRQGIAIIGDHLGEDGLAGITHA